MYLQFSTKQIMHYTYRGTTDILMLGPAVIIAHHVILYADFLMC